MKQAWMFGALVAALVVPTATVQAQESSSMGMSFRVGLFYPADSQTQLVGKNWTSFGVDFKWRDIGTSADGVKTRLQFSADYLQKGDYRSIPVTLNLIGDTGQLYYFGGAGASFTKLRNTDNKLEDEVRFAYQAGLGYKFSNYKVPVFIELKWMGTSESRFNGWGVFAGVKF